MVEALGLGLANRYRCGLTYSIGFLFCGQSSHEKISVETNHRNIYRNRNKPWQTHNAKPSQVGWDDLPQSSSMNKSKSPLEASLACQGTSVSSGVFWV